MGSYSMLKKSVVSVILLSIFTCGIYYFFWLYQTTEQIARLDRNFNTTGGTAVLLSIITCGIYNIYWWYKIGDSMFRVQMDAGYRMPQNNGILYLILSIFGFSIIGTALLQTALNDFYDFLDSNPPSNDDYDGYDPDWN